MLIREHGVSLFLGACWLVGYCTMIYASNISFIISNWVCETFNVLISVNLTEKNLSFFAIQWFGYLLQTSLLPSIEDFLESCANWTEFLLLGSLEKSTELLRASLDTSIAL